MFCNKTEEENPQLKHWKLPCKPKCKQEKKKTVAEFFRYLKTALNDKIISISTPKVTLYVNFIPLSAKFLAISKFFWGLIMHPKICSM